MFRFLAFTWVALLPVLVSAQGFPRDEMFDRLRGGGVLLSFAMLDQPSVQREIQATPDQVSRAQALAQEQRTQLQGLSQLPRDEAARKIAQVRDAADTGLKQIFSAPQLARVQEIGLQQAGPLIGLTNPKVAEELQLTMPQRTELRTLQESMMQQLTRLAEVGQTQGLGRGRGMIEALRETQAAKQQADAKALALLTPDQQQHWTRLQGPRFEGEMQAGPLRGRFRQR